VRSFKKLTTSIIFSLLMFDMAKEKELVPEFKLKISKPL